MTTNQDLDFLLDDEEENDGQRKPPAPDAPGGQPEEDEAPQPVFDTVEDFLIELLAPMITRKLNGTSLTWCPLWFKHAEAVSRITSIWRAWENLRLDPALGTSTWWLQHCDPHLNVLLDPDNGPLASCSVKEGHTKHPLPGLLVERADPSLWLGTAFSTTRSATKQLSD